MTADLLRDCEHGRQKGKCDTCNLAQAEARIAVLEDALLAMVTCFERYEDTHTYLVMQQARAAIAKATGEQK